MSKKKSIENKYPDREWVIQSKIVNLDFIVGPIPEIIDKLKKVCENLENPTIDFLSVGGEIDEFEITGYRKRTPEEIQKWDIQEEKRKERVLKDKERESKEKEVVKKLEEEQELKTLEKLINKHKNKAKSILSNKEK